MGQAKCGQADGSWLNMFVGEGSVIPERPLRAPFPLVLPPAREAGPVISESQVCTQVAPNQRDAHALASGSHTPRWPTPGFTPSVIQNAVPDALGGFRQLAFLFLSFSVVLLHQGQKMRRI